MEQKSPPEKPHTKAVKQRVGKSVRKQKSPTETTHTRAVNIRMHDDVRVLIDHAAKVYGKTRSDFMIDAARRAAEDVLLDQKLVIVDEESYQHYLDVLDNPPTGEGFMRLMKANAPWRK